MRNETCYDDYLHRGDCEPNEFGQLVDTPLRAMSYYDYGVHVRVVLGDPADLGVAQYAFARHHSKYKATCRNCGPPPWCPSYLASRCPPRRRT